MKAIYYGTAPIGKNSRIMVRNGVFDMDGTLIIGEMECLDTGIIWRGSSTPPGWRRGITPPEEVGKFYRVHDIQIDSVRSETEFSLEEIPDHGTNR